MLSRFTEEREFHTKRSDPFLKEIAELEANQPILRASRKQMENAVRSGNVSGVLPYIASALHIEPLYNKDLASFMTASKNHFLNSLRKAGSRPNQWIEQQISSAYAKAGRPEVANLSSLALIGFEDDINEKKVSIARELEDQDRDAYNYAREDIERKTNKALKEYADKRQDLLSYELRVIADEYMSASDLELLNEVPQGTPLTPKIAQFLLQKYGSEEKAIKEAKKIGFEILPDEFYESVQ